MSNTVGVIIGRFQIDELHEGHAALIEAVIAAHSSVLILLGCSQSQPSMSSPMDYRVRAMMFSKYGNVMVQPLFDQMSDEIWAKEIDRALPLLYPSRSFVLYGGRDSFIPHYEGKYETRELNFLVNQSASEVRAKLGANPINSVEFRAGMIYTFANMYPRIYPCVDIAYLKDKEFVLLGRKASETGWRFPGGHVDPGEDYEHTARRELHEETGMVVEGKLTYVKSFKVEDWRDAGLTDVHTNTILFIAHHMFGNPVAGDDLAEVAWKKVEDHTIVTMVEDHKPLMISLIDTIRSWNV